MRAVTQRVSEASVVIDRQKVADINQGIGFLPDNSIDEFHAYHLLENLSDIFPTHELQFILEK